MEGLIVVGAEAGISRQHEAALLDAIRLAALELVVRHLRAVCSEQQNQASSKSNTNST